MANTSSPKLSVCLITYNHARFIREALDSVLNQETEFAFEVCIGEDESSDGTHEICREYARNHPDKIRLFERSRKDNIRVYGRPTGRFNFLETLRECRGEYVAWLEGDDYWTDPHKLQKQVDYLDQNPDVPCCFHHSIRVDEHSHTTQSPETLVLRQVTQTDFILGRREYVGTHATVFRNGGCRIWDQRWAKAVGSFDKFFKMYLIGDGAAVVLPEIMGAYREHPSGLYTSLRSLEKAYWGFRDQVWMLRIYGGRSWRSTWVISVNLVKATLRFIIKRTLSLFGR